MPPRKVEPTMSKDDIDNLADKRRGKCISLFNNFIQKDIKSMDGRNINVKLTRKDKKQIKRSKDYSNNFCPSIEGVLKRFYSTRGFSHGNYEEINDGLGFKWSVMIESEDASSISVCLNKTIIPDGVSIYFFNENGDCESNLENRLEDGEIWTKALPGTIVYLGLVYNGSSKEMSNKVKKELYFDSIDVGIVNPNPSEDGFLSRRKLQETNCRWTECVEDYKCCMEKGCGEQNQSFKLEHLENLSNAVAKMTWWEGGYRYACSASLINNANEMTFLMTANHCIKKDSKNLELYFNKVSSQCITDTCEYAYGVADTMGMEVLATSKKSDFTLFKPNESLPSDNGKTYYYLGWNSDPVEVNTTQYRVQ